MTMTITEALAELKLITNKVAKKQEWVLQNLVKPKHIADPLVDKGGLVAVMKQEMQAINDLQTRAVVIRRSIMASNIATQATVLEVTKTIYEWLVWKKDIAQNKNRFLSSIYANTKREFDKIANQPQAAKTDDNKTILIELEANTDYMQCTTDAAYIQEILDKLDGVLSLKNATTTIEV